MTFIVIESEALSAAFDRAAGACECIGGGCPALSHRPGVNRCFGRLTSSKTAFFFTVRRFVDRTNPDNIVALCESCAESPRKSAERVFLPVDAVAFAGDVTEDHAP